jgi:hypothetical protein
MPELALKKFKNRFTDEMVLAINFTGKQDQLLNILDWVIDSGGRAQGNVRVDDGLDLMIHEKGVGLVHVKPGDYISKTTSGFEIYPVMTFTRMHQKVDPVVQVIKKPVVFEAMQFTGDIENQAEIDEWLAKDGIAGSYKHNIPGTMIIYYRINYSDGSGAIDIKLGNWIVKRQNDIESYTEAEFAAIYQKVK